MAVSVPYHPGLVLGNILESSYLSYIQQHSQIQGQTEKCRKQHNALTQQKNKLDMIREELVSMGVDETDLSEIDNEIQRVRKKMLKAAVNYSKAVINTEKQLASLEGSTSLASVSSQSESPVDFMKSEMMAKPLASDSIELDMQFFHLDSHTTDPTAFAAQIARHVAHQSGHQLADQVQKKVMHHASQHNIQGTLVISANCTHRTASVFSPLVLDPEKAVRAWNACYPGQAIAAQSVDKVKKTTSSGRSQMQTLDVLSGATFGSSFVGMVHFIQDDTLTSAGEKARSSGYLTQSNLQIQCSFVSMGIIPETGSSTARTVVSDIAGDTRSQVQAMSFLNSDREDEFETEETLKQAEEERSNYKNMLSHSMKSVVEAFSQTAMTEQNVLNLDTLMTIFDNFTESARNTKKACGVPLNYYITQYTRDDILQLFQRHTRATSKQSESSHVPQEES
ncbi:hypothetical protein VA7868_00366 [Vibrio aerogenes CECT 7868]|uniref:Uncharacterized protein n=1 Tax=Vibrio aerogenes CECT 7868 TaxID=1216006 RepID=A0A1M5VEW0_9VIBR|nr:hypothetical protein [Vibrio aerogenes]SHH73731.1 hypothetical protein VA7868_00366 [Vibrio aerogenes CECT 7868]